MAAFNLRGVLIQPEPNTNFNFYLCLIDLPAKADPYSFKLIKPETEEAYLSKKQLDYCYEGILPESDEDHTRTVMLPFYHLQHKEVADTIVLTDRNGNRITGSIQRQSPVTLPVDINSRLSPVIKVIKSETNRDQYFVIVITATAPAGGYSLGFESMTSITENPIPLERKLIACKLRQAENGFLISLGAVPSVFEEFVSAFIIDETGTTGLTKNIDYNESISV